VVVILKMTLYKKIAEHRYKNWNDILKALRKLYAISKSQEAAE
jgi:hypothetical protein